MVRLAQRFPWGRLYQIAATRLPPRVQGACGSLARIQAKRTRGGSVARGLPAEHVGALGQAGSQAHVESLQSESSSGLVKWVEGQRGLWFTAYIAPWANFGLVAFYPTWAEFTASRR